MTSHRLRFPSVRWLHCAEKLLHLETATLRNSDAAERPFRISSGSDRPYLATMQEARGLCLARSPQASLTRSLCEMSTARRTRDLGTQFSGKSVLECGQLWVPEVRGTELH